MAEELPKPIVVKKINKGGHGHHGGAWKIAYADFVTAMMAFFLLMWLLGSTSKAQKEGISEYFQTPLIEAMTQGPSVGKSSSVIDGGGRDVTKKEGQVKPVDGDPGRQKTVVVSNGKGMKKTSDVLIAKEAAKKAEKKRLVKLKNRMTAEIKTNPTLQKFKEQLKVDLTSEGLRIQIVDEKNRALFKSGKDTLRPYGKVILREIGAMLNDVPNKISLSGHTDAAGYSSGDRGYSNWELSSDRANASRRELVKGGMNEDTLLKVVGLSSSSLLDKENPFNPINRRISLILLNKEAEEKALRDYESVELESEADQRELKRIALPERPEVLEQAQELEEEE